MRKQFWLENLREREYSEDLEIDVRIILEWILGVSVRHKLRQYLESHFLL
jgi:hypothetical protein